MQSVLIVCGAGASSTFLASRIRAIAATRGIALTAAAASTNDLRALLRTSTVLLVGPHLAESFDALSEEAALLGVPVAMLAPTAFGPGGAEDAIELVGSLVTLGPNAPAAPSATKEG